jgi:hypothetical protein
MQIIVFVIQCNNILVHIFLYKTGHIITDSTKDFNFLSKLALQTWRHEMAASEKVGIARRGLTKVSDTDLSFAHWM